MLDINALQEALDKVSEIGVTELEFEMNDQKLALRHLSDEEEVEVFKYSQEVLVGVENQAIIHEMFHRFKISTLAFALVQIGSLDLRGQKFIGTGEFLENKKEIRRPKYEVLRKILSGWTRPVLNRCFLKYGEMLESQEIAAERALEFEPSDIDSEVDRLEKKIEELKKLKEKRASQEIDDKGKFIRNLLKQEKFQLTEGKTDLEDARLRRVVPLTEEEEREKEILEGASQESDSQESSTQQPAPQQPAQQPAPQQPAPQPVPQPVPQQPVPQQPVPQQPVPQQPAPQQPAPQQPAPQQPVQQPAPQQPVQQPAPQQPVQQPAQQPVQQPAPQPAPQQPVPQQPVQPAPPPNAQQVVQQVQQFKARPPVRRQPTAQPQGSQAQSPPPQMSPEKIEAQQRAFRKQTRQQILDSNRQENTFVQPSRYSGVEPLPEKPSAGRQPPHLAARQVSEEIEVFEVPTQMVGGPGGGGKKRLKKGDEKVMNPVPQTSKNPNFVPPRGR